MSNLSNRVQISKQLVIKKIFSPNPNKHIYSTLTHDGNHHYQMVLEKSRGHSKFGDAQMGHDVIITECIACHQPVGPCPGNSHHTICKHMLGAIRKHMAINGCSIAFCQNIFDAIKLRKPGQSLVKIVSGQGQAVLWGVVEVKESQIDKQFENVSALVDRWLVNVQAMRGSQAEAEGID